VGTVLKGATLIELEPASVERGELRIEGGQFVERGPQVQVMDGDEVIDLGGKLVMPGMVSAHQHLYTSLARGMPAPLPPPENFAEMVERRWWRLDQALDLDAVHVAAVVGALDALCSGTTTVLDQHASSRAVAGSLTRVARGMNEVGLRGVLSYEVSDRHGAVGREEALDENASFLKKAQGRFRGMIGAHASYTLSQDALDGLRELSRSTGAGLHLSVAEDPTDEKLSVEKFGSAAVDRLMASELLNDHSVVAHCVHPSWPELAQLISTGAWLVHCPRSNMTQQVGYAPAGRFGSRATLGCDLHPGDLFSEAQVADFRSRDAGQPIDVLRYLTNGHRLASQAFGQSIGPLQPGSVADLLVLDYRSPTPLRAENLAQHLASSLGARHVESVMVDGIWRMWARRPLSVDPNVVAEHAREISAEVWRRVAELK